MLLIWGCGGSDPPKPSFGWPDGIDGEVPRSGPDAKASGELPVGTPDALQDEVSSDALVDGDDLHAPDDSVTIPDPGSHVDDQSVDLPAELPDGVIAADGYQSDQTGEEDSSSTDAYLDLDGGTIPVEPCSEEGECPQGQICTALLYPSGDEETICLPEFLTLCMPCAESADCRPEGPGKSIIVALQEYACVPAEEGGSFCASPCDIVQDCPVNYVCTAMTDVDGNAFQGCLYQGEECECSAYAVEVSASTPCEVENKWGECPGVHVCTADGLAPCQGQLPAEDVCNGIDDDCDGVVDNDYPDKNGNGVADCIETGCWNEEYLAWDEDCDGYPDIMDCSPDPAVHPMAEEICDGLDNDCNGIADDENSPGCSVYYADADGDGFGSEENKCLCSPTEPYVLDGPGDCDDTNSSVNPWHQEICDQLDNDCDGTVDGGLTCQECQDLLFEDHVYAFCVKPRSWQQARQACLETGMDLASVSSENEDIWMSGEAQGLAAETGWWFGLNDIAEEGVFVWADGEPVSFTDWAANEPNDWDNNEDCGSVVNHLFLPQWNDTVCGNEVPFICEDPDTDGDGTSDQLDEDDDGDGIPDGLDNCPLVVNSDQEDHDLDGLGDICDDDMDNDGDPNGSDCEPLDGAVSSIAPEICDGIDNNCDGAVDEDFECVCGTLDECGTEVGLCTMGVRECLDGAWSECSGVNPSDELCDGLDNNCDGEVDDGLGATTCGLGVCEVTTANCIDGQLAECVVAWDLAVDEICDGQDNNCDGLLDEDQGSTTCGLGPCEHTVENCVSGLPVVCNPTQGASAEKCDNLDNDCDGTVDEGAEANPSCNDGNPCTTDVCQAGGNCKSTMSQTACAAIGCSDGSREVFANQTNFATIAGCAGDWSKGNLRKNPTGTVNCGAGNNPCPAAADLCAPGWHVCMKNGQPGDLSNRITGNKCNNAGSGIYLAASSHCSANSGCNYGKPFPCWSNGYCSEPVCCGSGCKKGGCKDAVWAGKTEIFIGQNHGCANSASTQFGAITGILCCKN